MFLLMNEWSVMQGSHGNHFVIEVMGSLDTKIYQIKSNQILKAQFCYDTKALFEAVWLHLEANLCHILILW